MVQMLEHARAFLEAEGVDCEAVLQGAHLALMLAPLGHASMVRVEISDNRVAWCRGVKSGDITCVAIAPRGSLFDVDNLHVVEFFAAAWPDDWTWWHKERGAQHGKGAAVSDPIEEGHIVWAADAATGKVRLAMAVSSDPLAVSYGQGAAPILAQASGLEWRGIAADRQAGMRLVWEAGHVLQPSIGLALGWGARYAKGKAPKVAKDAKAPKQRTAAQEAATARWLEACKAGREAKKARQAAGVAAARDVARQNVQDGQKDD